MFQQDVTAINTNVFRKTPEGYLTGKICVTGAGVFRYLNDDRKFVGRLRSVEEVKKATESINCKPITLQHPNKPVTLDDVSKLSVGMSANDASFDGLNNYVTLTVTDKDAVNAIERGEVKAISMGYRCNVSDNVGVWQGSKHDQEQKDIVYNHIALVREGRAGDQVKFQVGDSAEMADFFDMADIEDENMQTAGITEDGKGCCGGKNPPKKTETIDNQHQQEQSTMKTIQLDGVDYQADEKVIEALQEAQNDAATKLDEIHTLLDHTNELETQVADLQEKLDAANDEIDEGIIDAAVNAKIKILDTARAAGIECGVEDDVSDLKRQVIMSAFDSIDLEAVEDESSINALFNAACGVISKRAEKDGSEEPANRCPATAQFDGAGSAGSHAQTDSMEEKLLGDLIKISNGKEA